MDVDMAQLLGDGADKTCPDDRSKFGTDPKKIQNVLCYDYIISVFFFFTFFTTNMDPTFKKVSEFYGPSLMGGPMGRYESTTFLGDGFIIIHFYNINYYSCSCVRTIARNSAKWVEPISMRDAENQRYFSHVNHGSE